MRLATILWKTLTSRRGGPPARRRRQAVLAWDGLEDRTVLSHVGGFHAHAFAHSAALRGAAHNTGSSSGSTASTSTTSVGTSSGGTLSGSTTTSGTTSTSNTALDTARQTLRSDVQAIELGSSTTIGQLTAIKAAFQTLSADGLSADKTALATFENSLVTANASATTLSGNADLLSQFEALYTSTPTTQQTTDLTAAYEALASAVVSANISSSDISIIDADYAAVQAAQGSTSTSTYPYFSLVTGQAGGVGAGCHH